MKLKAILSTFWQTLKRPPTTIGLGVLTVGGFMTGIIFWGGFNTAMEYTNTEAFCIGCHEMRDNVYQELQTTVHWSNRTGVRATCPDCHVPHEWTNKIARKMQASKEVWGAVFGTIDTREKFLAKRGELAQHEWARLEANGSLECRNCHDYDSMNWAEMSSEAVFYMKPAAENNTGCIECHKGIAHQLPDDMNTSSPTIAKLEREADSGSLAAGEDYFAIRSVKVFEDEAFSKPAGELTLAAPIEVIETKGDKVHFTVSAWRKEKGFKRVLFDDFGRNIRVAVLEKETAANESLVNQAGDVTMDEATGLDWSPVKVSLWAEKGSFVGEIDALWSAAAQTYATACSTCHGQPDPGHFDTNTWPALFNGMVGFTNMGPETQTLVLTYLQKHSSDYGESH